MKPIARALALICRWCESESGKQVPATVCVESRGLYIGDFCTKHGNRKVKELNKPEKGLTSQ